MMLKKYFSFGFLFLSTVFAVAQSAITISGTVIDGITQENLVFVNIGVEGTLTGTASNADGEFTLNISSALTDKMLYFSAIGYKNFSIPIQQYIKQRPSNIALQPLTYDIDDIEISTTSRVLYRIVRDAAQAVDKYYVQQPYSFNALYSNEEYADQVLTKKRDALATISDATGYTSKKNAFAARNYQFTNMHRNFDIKSLKAGTTLMDDLLFFDIARTNGNILDTLYINDYDLKMVEQTTMNGDSVWVIAYQLSTPTFSRTRDFHVTSFKGKLYISKTNNVLLKAETHVKSDWQSQLGRMFAAQPETATRDVEYNFATTYKPTAKGYALDRITLNSAGINNNDEPIRNIASLLVVDENFGNPDMLSNRQYFEKMISDLDFWSKLE